MSETKQILLYIHPQIKEAMHKMGANAWIQTQIKQYQPQLKMPPVPNQKKINYRPILTQETLIQLEQIPGRNPTHKITNLYYNQKTRENKKRQRKKILKELFPTNPYS